MKQHLVTLKKNGFTLIELLVVVSIIAILAGLILVNMSEARSRAKDTKLKNDANQVKTALRLYYNDNNIYPTCSAGSTCDCTNISAKLTGYIDTSLLPTGSNCQYTTLNSNDSFRMYVVLNSSSGTTDTESYSKCGYSPSVEGRYAVCSE